MTRDPRELVLCDCGRPTRRPLWSGALFSRCGDCTIGDSMVAGSHQELALSGRHMLRLWKRGAA